MNILWKIAIYGQNNYIKIGGDFNLVCDLHLEKEVAKYSTIERVLRIDYMNPRIAIDIVHIHNVSNNILTLWQLH